MKPWKGRLATLVVSGLLIGTGAGQAQEPSQQDLDALRAAIERLERELESQIHRRDAGIAELKSIEESLAATRRQLAELAGSVAAQSERQAEITRQSAAARENLADEQDALAAQARMSYMMGRQELLKMLLSQEDPSDFGRMLVYYDYLNRHRADRIETVTGELARLAELEVEAAAVARELESLHAQEQAEIVKLESARAERQSLIDELDSAIAASGSEIERMREEEAVLDQIIMRLAEELEGFSFPGDAPFTDQRGKLSWPVDGDLAAEFGDPRDEGGTVRWSGVLLRAPEGTTVRAIYHGRVIHSQWQRGMGLLLVLDHGDGYYSLYGHNAALLRQAGDWVDAGEPIAEVGNTGGQQVPGLYFGIREDGEPIDPARWVR